MNYDSFNNNVLLVGRATSDLVFSHAYSYTNKVFYKFTIDVVRSQKKNGDSIIDSFPISISGDQLEKNEVAVGQIKPDTIVLVRGAIKTLPRGNIIARKISILTEINENSAHNAVDLVGCVFGEVTFSSDRANLSFFDLSILRKFESGIKEDRIPIVCQKKIAKEDLVKHGNMLSITGSLRCRQKVGQDILSVYASKVVPFVASQSE